MVSVPSPATSAFEPAWEVAHLFPLQGTWSEDDYLELVEMSSGLVELTDGNVEVLEMPTTEHQDILLFLIDALRSFVVARKLGKASLAPLPVRVGKTKIREPDILFVLEKNRDKVGSRIWNGVDLAMEIVSSSDESRHRDYQKKRADYAAAGIAEYWIVDPAESRITVLKLEGDTYAVHGEFTPGDAATSVLLDGFSVDVTSVFAAAQA